MNLLKLCLNIILVSSMASPTAWGITPSGVVSPQDALADARARGERDGRARGDADGRAAGFNEGRTAGDREGYRNGYARCERDMQERERDRGYRDGFSLGDREGDRDGINQGNIDGQRRGQTDGDQDGTRRANSDALNAATGPGRERGYQDANGSDAAIVGQREGIAAADRDARAEAERLDYPRGREALKSERWNEPVAREDSFSQRPPALLGGFSGFSLMAELPPKRPGPGRPGPGEPGRPGRPPENPGRPGNPPGNPGRPGNPPGNPTNPPVNPPPPPQPPAGPTPEEIKRAYDQAYNSAYRMAYDSSKQRAYREAYDQASRASAERGCRDARGRDYRGHYNSGYETGRRDGYRQGYDRTYNVTYRSAYDRAFSSASHSAYSRSYDGFYRQHFESARASAYKERYSEIYQSAYRPAYQQKYNQVYPGYAEQAYQRGRSDEARDFQDRPLRLLVAVATETIHNGIFEPGEILRTQFKVRSFSAARLDGRQIKLTLVSLDADASVISEATSGLVRALEGKSETLVSDALEFRMNESAADTVKRFRLDVYVNGRLSDSREFRVETKFLAALGIPVMPDLKEGMETSIEVVVKNQSQVPTDGQFQVELVSRPEILEVLDGTKVVGVLAAGESRRLVFRVITRGHGDRLNLPLAIEARDGDRRRVGVLSFQRSIPVTNEYRVDVLNGVESLSQAGVVRLEYQITNVSSNLLMNSLQLSAQVSGRDGDNFVIVGPNPQFLAPMLPGQITNFVIPVLVREGGRSGTLELEIKENGRTTMVHRRSF